MSKKKSGIEPKMAWIRNLERYYSLGTDQFTSHYECEVLSECWIGGIFHFRDDFILCSPISFQPDQFGLYHYLIRIKSAQNDPDSLKYANKKGYYFRDGIFGELIVLLTLHFRCRFFLFSTSYSEIGTDKAVRSRDFKKIDYRKVNPALHPPVLRPNSGRKFVEGVDQFFDSLLWLETKFHQSVVNACHQYSRALKEIGVNPEMIYIRLVSAIECLSESFDLSIQDDPLKRLKFEEIVDCQKLNNEAILELKSIFDLRKSQRKFERFIEMYSKGFFKGGYYRKRKTVKIFKKNLPKYIKRIYSARSAYLHRGESMYISETVRGSEKWDLGPSVGMIIDQRRIEEKARLPLPYFFEGLVRHCILAFIEKNQLPKQNE